MLGVGERERALVDDRRRGTVGLQGRGSGQLELGGMKIVGSWGVGEGVG